MPASARSAAAPAFASSSALLKRLFASAVPVSDAFDVAAGALGNTRNVCRKYYVHPVLSERYKEDGLEKEFLSIAKKKDNAFFTAQEKVLLALLQQYQPDFLKKEN